MVFNSVVFLFCFLPLSLLLYYLVPGRAKNAVLLAESLIFYCWTGVAFLPLIAVLIVFNYLWALLTARAKAKLRGLLPLAAVLVNLGVLVYFKYANFLIDTVNQVAHLGLAALNIGTVLPLGISYYIFKIISYEVDVCTGKIAPEKNFITFAVYVLFFPQLIVGHIQVLPDRLGHAEIEGGAAHLPQLTGGNQGGLVNREIAIGRNAEAGIQNIAAVVAVEVKVAVICQVERRVGACGGLVGKA